MFRITVAIAVGLAFGYVPPLVLAAQSDDASIGFGLIAALGCVLGAGLGTWWATVGPSRGDRGPGQLLLCSFLGVLGIHVCVAGFAFAGGNVLGGELALLAIVGITPLAWLGSVIGSSISARR